MPTPPPSKIFGVGCRRWSMAAWLIAMGLNAGVCAASTEPEQRLTFERDVRLILKAHCFHCHGEDGTQEGGIDLRQVRLMRETGAIDEASPSSSSLLAQLRSGAMPKGGKPLPEDEIARIALWLEQGAHTARPEPTSVPSYEITAEERNHWSFQPVVRPAIPDVGEAHPVDAFIVSELQSHGLGLAPTADRVTLIRRAAFDLLGLPPTPEEVEEFLADDQPGAWERLIDRYLASAHYGERWGRHWLDVVGYADSNGGPRDRPRQHAWHYRDYVVRSFNANKPWDQFLQEQLAGDELVRATRETADEVLSDPSTWDALAATGFWRMAPDFTADAPPDEVLAREAVIVDNLKVLGSAVLGLTMGCAQCHDHRFDPVAHTDYYRLRALIEPVFDPQNWRNSDQREHEAYTAAEREANAAIEARAAEVDRQRTELIDREYARYLEERMKDLPEDVRVEVRRAWNTPADQRTDADRQLLKQHDCDFSKADHLRFLPDRGEQEEQRSKWVKEAQAIRATKLSRVLMVAHELRDQLPVTRRYHRGDHRQPKEEIGPGELTLFDFAPEIPAADPDQFSSGRRLAYARWLTSGRHPLVSRVLVNRFWSHHFGQGLVTTLADFGLRTPRPTYGDLLDWLATDFVESGWDLKLWHRRVMTSRAYQQANRHPAAEAVDADNRLLARYSLKRLEAEGVRDALLAVCGNLSPEIGGAPVSVARHPDGGVVLGKELTNDSNNVVHTVLSAGAAANRRSLYVQSLRNRPLTVLETFDLPMMLPNCNQRAVTTVAPQSLLMMNDLFVIEQSRVLATRLQAAHPGDRTSMVQQLWRRAYSTWPSNEELSGSLQLLNEECERQQALSVMPEEAETRALAALCQVVFASNRFLYVP
jgi:cytochrome c553